MCSVVFHHILFILVIQLSMKGLHCKPHGISRDQGCPTTGVPINGRRGTNLIYDTKPLYRFDMGDTDQGYNPGDTYQLYVKAQDPDRKFTEVLLSTTVDTESCGTGTFILDPELHGQPSNCSHMVYKLTRPQEHTFTFSWTAPQCGCVEFRVRVKSSQDIYYLDDAGTNNGFLSHKTCSKDLTKYVTELPISKRINILCAINQKTSVSTLYKRPNVLTRRKINFRDMSLLQMEDLKINLHRRSEEVRECCSRNGQEKHECFGDIRRLRIDQFCEDGEPIIPFIITRLDYMTQHKEKCCWRLGERRYACFAESGLEGAQDGQQADWVKRTNILDESDPLNDIEDYPTELNEQLNKLNILPRAMTTTIPNTFHKHSGAHKNHHSHHKSFRTNVKKTRMSEADEVETTVKTSEYTESTMVSTTGQTTEELLRAMQRAQMSYECCNSGKNYASSVKHKDYWKICEKSARKYSRSRYTKARGKCRRYYHQCCVEQVQLLERRTVEQMAPANEKPITTEPLNGVSGNKRFEEMTQGSFTEDPGVTGQRVGTIPYSHDTTEETSDSTSLGNSGTRNSETTKETSGSTSLGKSGTGNSETTEEASENSSKEPDGNSQTTEAALENHFLENDTNSEATEAISDNTYLENDRNSEMTSEKMLVDNDNENNENDEDISDSFVDNDDGETNVDSNGGYSVNDYDSSEITDITSSDSMLESDMYNSDDRDNRHTKNDDDNDDDDDDDDDDGELSTKIDNTSSTLKTINARNLQIPSVTETILRSTVQPSVVSTKTLTVKKNKRKRKRQKKARRNRRKNKNKN